MAKLPSPYDMAREIRWAYQRDGTAGVQAVVRYFAHRAEIALGPGRVCPICGWRGSEFEPILTSPPPFTIWRARALCPACGSKERHRAYFAVLERFLAAHLRDIGRQGSVRVVHFAPEPCLSVIFERPGIEYLKSNYVNPAPGELVLDLQSLALADSSVDLIFMSHVLVCVPDDRAAVREMHRVLRPGGAAVVGENVSPDGPTEEWNERGHGGTCRRYGFTDLAERFAPFSVELVDASAELSAVSRTRYGVRSPEYLVVLRRSSEVGAREGGGRTPS